MAMEQEIKLTALAQETLDAVLQDPMVSMVTEGGMISKPFYAVYYDTPDRILWRNQLAFRGRQQGAAWRIGLKGNGTVIDGVSHREELEEVTSGPVTTLAELQDGPIRRRILDLVPATASLLPLVITDIQRRALIIRPSPDCRAELVADQGFIRAGEREVAIFEIELELLDGRLEPLLELADHLISRHGLIPSNHSKFSLGLSLLGQE